MAYDSTEKDGGEREHRMDRYGVAYCVFRLVDCHRVHGNIIRPTKKWECCACCFTLLLVHMRTCIFVKRLTVCCFQHSTGLTFDDTIKQTSLNLQLFPRPVKILVHAATQVDISTYDPLVLRETAGPHRLSARGAPAGAVFSPPLLEVKGSSPQMLFFGGIRLVEAPQGRV